MHMTCKTGRRRAFGRKGTLTLPSFQLKKKKGEKWRDEGKLPTDYKYKWRVQRKQTLQKGYEEVTIKFLFTF